MSGMRPKNQLLNRFVAIVFQFKHPLYSIANVQQYDMCICNQFSYFEKIKVKMSFTMTCIKDKCYVAGAVGKKVHLGTKWHRAVKKSSM